VKKRGTKVKKKRKNMKTMGKIENKEEEEDLRICEGEEKAKRK